jgi:hypothetical protein
MASIYHVSGRIYLLLMLVCILMVPPGLSSAQMVLLNDEALSGFYATGFSNFSVTNGIAKAWFNVNASVYADIDSIKMGYHDEYDYKDPNPGFGWDEDWTGVTLGDSGTDLLMEGLYIEAKFINIDDPATRRLEYVLIGVDNMNNDITADFNSFSGYIDDSNDGTPEIIGHGLDLGTRTITTTNSEFYLMLSADGANKGWRVYFNNASVSP